MAWLKDFIIKKFNIKDLKKVKTIIDSYVTKNLNIKILKINQLAFIHDFFKSNNIIDFNLVNISMKTKCFIDITKLENYKKSEIKLY